MCLLLSILVAKWPSYASGKELSFSLPCVSFVTFCQFMNRYILSIGVGRFRIFGGGGGGGGGGLRFGVLGAKGGANSQQAHDVVLTSMQRNDVASTSF